MAMNGLERITEKILAEARTEADRILSAADAEADRIRSDYAARADEIRASLSDAAQREGNDMIARAKAEASNRKRNRMLAERSRMVNETFESAMREIRGLQTEQYMELLVGLLTAAVMEQLDAERIGREIYQEETAPSIVYEVLFNVHEGDQIGGAVVEGARKKLAVRFDRDSVARLVLSEQRAPIDGGFILRVGEIEVNCSWSSIFSRLREELEIEVSRALFYYEKRT